MMLQVPGNRASGDFLSSAWRAMYAIVPCIPWFNQRSSRACAVMPITGAPTRSSQKPRVAAVSSIKARICCGSSGWCTGFAESKASGMTESSGKACAPEVPEVCGFGSAFSGGPGGNFIRAQWHKGASFGFKKDAVRFQRQNGMGGAIRDVDAECVATSLQFDGFDNHAMVIK